MAGSPLTSKPFVEKWSRMLAEVEPMSLLGWSGQPEDFRAIYKELIDNPPKTEDERKKRRFVLTLFPDLLSIFAPLEKSVAFKKGTKNRASMQQIGQLAKIVLEEKDTDEEEKERDIVEQTLTQYIRGGKKWIEASETESLREGILIKAPISVDKKMMEEKSLAVKSYLTSATKKCTNSSDELNALCKNTLKRLRAHLLPQLAKARSKQEAALAATQASSRRKRKHAEISQEVIHNNLPTRTTGEALFGSEAAATTNSSYSSLPITMQAQSSSVVDDAPSDQNIRNTHDQGLPYDLLGISFSNDNPLQPSARSHTDPTLVSLTPNNLSVELSPDLNDNVDQAELLDESSDPESESDSKHFRDAFEPGALNGNTFCGSTDFK